MKKPDFPVDEVSRLQCLTSLNILDTDSEERFDRLTRMAKRIFNVSIALVSLVDENRQWFKSCVGLSVSETPRDISFCGHAILDDSVFIIPDACKDERFADNPLVLNEPNIRFYAGCPLVVNSNKLGTLCIIDQKPREFSNDDVEVLRDLASMVERELEAIQLATLDDLTKLSNRRGFLLLSEHSLSVSRREKLPLVLIFMDLDRFKFVNDEFGHAEGDKALITFANLLKSTFRESDIFARLGGDEFVILLSGNSKEQIEEIIDRFRDSLNEYNQQSESGYEILFSYGLVEFDHAKHQTIEELMAEGDALMYQSKNG